MLNKKLNKNYDASSIQVLKGLEGVRKRPGMYIGNTDDISGLHHMLFEVLDNSIDEALAGYCDEITVTLHQDGYVSVEDNGRGMPIDIHPVENKSAAEVIMTQLHAGGKFSQDSYEFSGGLHGLGVSVVNALSESLILRVKKDKKEYQMTFVRGSKTSELEEINSTSKSGTSVKFKPDPEIFSILEFEASLIANRLEELAFLNPGIKINLNAEKASISKSFIHKSGLLGFIDSIIGDTERITPPISLTTVYDKVAIDVVMIWLKTQTHNALFFTNTIQQRDGGTHVSGFRFGVTRALQNYVKNKGTKNQQKIDFSGDDTREGLYAVVAIKVADPKFSSQTKEKLVSSNVRYAVEAAIFKKMEEWLEENPNEANILINKVLQSALAREAARRAREMSNKKSSLSLQVSKKLAACSDKNPENCELFIVEGDSAGGSAKQARNRFFQAVLPLRGKILNIEKVNFSKVLSSEVISTLISAIGMGIGDDVDITKLRYHKVIIMTDSDVDGRHISALLLVFFFRYMKDLILNGHLYIASPPLYGIVHKNNKIDYVRDDEAFHKYMISLSSKNIVVQKDNKNILDDEKLDSFLFDTFKISNSLKLKYKNNWLLKNIISAKAIEGDIVEALHTYLSRFNDGNWSIINIANENPNIYSKVILHQHNGISHKHFIDESITSHFDVISEYINKWGFMWNNGILVNDIPIIDPFDFLDKLISKATRKIHVQRYKGLGEMNAKALGETAMKNYTVVTLDEIEEAEKICIDLMGNDVMPRKEFISKNALYADLDV